MNIAMFTNNYKPFIGGVPISIERLADGLRALGHTVYIFAPEYDNQEDDEYIIRCKVYAMKQKNYVIPKIWTRGIETQFKTLQIDMIHVHHPLLLGEVGKYLGKKYNIPTVLTYHTRYEQYLHNMSIYHKLEEHARQTSNNKVKKIEQKILQFTRDKLTPSYLKWFANRCDGIITPTPLIREYLMEEGIKRPMYVLPTGLSEDNIKFNEEQVKKIKEKYKGNKKYLLCSVSRLSDEKNLFFLLKGLKQLKLEIGDCFNFIIIGEGEQRGALEAEVKRLELENNVYLLGNKPNKEMSHYYKACDVFTFASMSETQGIVLIEAMAAGLPVVAIKATGVADCVVNNINGYMTQNDVGEWCGQIRYILEKENVRDKLAVGAYQTAMTYLNSEIALRATLYYKQIIANQKEREIRYVPKKWKIKHFT